ncbi:hypothetical protein [Mucilaginibacter flavus]|uniref:hypothetical protein n=1 Tax=Mucilaginibacter flavus TaxID=931504 RepID=UPI0025B47E48|nr:hypothetical protein [Mucilaginibacter flavus]MDN3582353.1 hypothetical protein [Mucilaginibacter flavus]
MKTLEYLLYGLPLIFIYLSRVYMRKFKRLNGTGKIPDIIGAKRRQNIYLFLAVVSSALIVLVVIQF